MTREEAVRILNCYDGSADIQVGTIGSFNQEVSALMEEMSGGDKNYINLLIWTRGEEAACSTGGDTSAVGAALRPDGVKYSALAFDGAGGEPGFHCFSTIHNQIVVRLGGPPDTRVVTGVWHLQLPEDGKRPSMRELAGALKQRYPFLEIVDDDNDATGMVGFAHHDRSGNLLNAVQIEEDSRTLRPPVVPMAPKTTRGCGFLLMSTCPRDVPLDETARYNAALVRYDEDMKTYEPRRVQVATYAGCIRLTPERPGGANQDDSHDSECGTSYVAAASPYPGGFAEATFVGIYDPQTARAARLRLDAHLTGLRGEVGRRSAAPAL